MKPFRLTDSKDQPLEGYEYDDRSTAEYMVYILAYYFGCNLKVQEVVDPTTT
jgi:hypothetical protein